jgi:ribosome-binding factor A
MVRSGRVRRLDPARDRLESLEWKVMSERMRRINESVRHALGEALPALKDPRIGFVTVTAVRTTSDLSQARVFVSVLGSKKKITRTVAALNAASGVLHARLNRELHMKRIPQLTFEYDPTAVEAVRMTKLIDELAPDDENDSDES